MELKKVKSTWGDRMSPGVTLTQPEKTDLPSAFHTWPLESQIADSEASARPFFLPLVLESEASLFFLDDSFARFDENMFWCNIVLALAGSHSEA